MKGNVCVEGRKFYWVAATLSPFTHLLGSPMFLVSSFFHHHIHHIFVIADGKCYY